MSKPKLNKTYSSFSRNHEINRSEEIRRDNDTIKTPKCTIYDVDNAIMSYLTDIVQLQIIENNNIIPVPVIFANGEKWAQIRSRGYMYDHSDKLMTPLIAVKRNTITERDTLKKLDVNWNPETNDEYARNTITFENSYSKRNRYDRFSVLQGTRPRRELYIAPVPEFVEIAYDLLLWTEYTEQMNSVVEQLMTLGGYAWGTTWKFFTQIQDYSFENVSAPGDDRVVRATIPITVKASLMMPYELRRSQIQKRYSIKRVVFGSENESFNADADWDGA